MGDRRMEADRRAGQAASYDVKARRWNMKKGYPPT